MARTLNRTPHTEMTVNRNPITNASQADLGPFLLLKRIQKERIKFKKHLKSSDPNSYNYKATEENIKRSPLSQLALTLTSSHSTRPQDSPT